MRDVVANIAQESNPWWASPTRRLEPALPHRRELQPRLTEHVASEPRRAALLLGPRQVGKTAILHQCVDDLLREGWPATNVTYFDFSDDRLWGKEVSPRLVAAHRPPGFDETRPHVLFLDEISKAHAWPEWLKQVVDRRTHRVVATDSAAFVLREAGRESGVGRWDDFRLEGLTYHEFLRLQSRGGEATAEVERRLPAAFNRYLARGGFPGFVSVESARMVRQRLREAIGDKALRRDLLEAGVDTERVAALFNYIVQGGKEFDAKKVADALSAGGFTADPRSIRKWVSVLEDTMLVTRIENLAGSAFSRMKSSAHPRYYASDHGLISAFAAVPDPLADSETRGLISEAVVYRHLRTLTGHHEIWIGFRRNRKDEIDFLVQRATGGPVAIEVDSSANPNRGKVRRLEERGGRVDAARLLYVYGGSAAQDHGAVTLVPLRDFTLDTERWVQP